MVSNSHYFLQQYLRVVGNDKNTDNFEYSEMKNTDSFELLEVKNTDDTFD